MHLHSIVALSWLLEQQLTLPRLQHAIVGWYALALAVSMFDGSSFPIERESVVSQD